MQDKDFDQNIYIQQLEQMSDSQLCEHFRAVDRMAEPYKWRIATEALARRGIFELPSGNIGESIRKNTLLFTPALKIGAIWLFSVVIIFLASYMIEALSEHYHLFSFTQPVSIATEKGAYSLFSFRKREREDKPEKYIKSYAYFIRGEEMTEFKAPPVTGNIFTLNNRIYVVSKNNEEASMALGEDGSPQGEWVIERAAMPVGMKRIECYSSQFFTYKNKTYRFMKLTGYTTDCYREKESGGLFDHITGERINGDLGAAFKEMAKRNHVRTIIFVIKNNIYMISGGEDFFRGDLYISRYDGRKWSYTGALCESTRHCMDPTSDGTKIFAIAGIDTRNKKKIAVITFDGEDIHAKNIRSSNKSELFYNYSNQLLAENGNLYLINNDHNGFSPVFYKIEDNELKPVNKRYRAGYSSFFARPYIYLIIYAAVLFSGILVSSRIARKELVHEIEVDRKIVPVPTILRRFGALFIDWLLVYPLTIFCLFRYTNKNIVEVAGYCLLSAFIAAALLLFLYSFILEGFCGGQTLGKKIFKIRVVKDDLTRCAPGAAATRFLLRIIDSFGAYIIAALVFASTEKFQRIGDMVARTIVVMDEPGLPLPGTKKNKAGVFIPPVEKKS